MKTIRYFTVILLFNLLSVFVLNCVSEKNHYNISSPFSLSRLQDLPFLSWDDLPEDETASFYHWAEYYLKQSMKIQFFSMEEIQSPGKHLTKAQFISKLCKCIERPTKIYGDMPYEDVPMHTQLYDDILFALQVGILDVPTANEPQRLSFHPQSPITRWESAVWLTNAKKVDFSYYQENVLHILTQDGLSGFPSEKVKLAVGVSLHPAYQLLPYRWSTDHEYRLAKPYGLLNVAEASFALFHFLYSPQADSTMRIAKEGYIDLEQSITKESFEFLSPYIYTPAISQRDMNWGYAPLLVTEIPTIDTGSLRFLDDGRVQCIYTIRDHLIWSNNDPIVAQDAITGFQFARHYLQVSVPFEWLLGIKTETPNTVLVTWKRPFYGVERAFFLYPQSLEFPLLWDDYQHCASFLIDRWDEQSLVLTENRRSVMGCIPDASISIDFVQQPLPTLESYDMMIPAQYDYLDYHVQNGTPEQNDTRILIAPSMQWEHIDFKLPNQLLNDRSLRQNLFDAISMQNLNDEVWHGHATVSSGWFLPLHPSLQKEFSVSHSVAEFEPVKIEETIQLIVLSADEQRKKTAEYIEQKWESLGLDVNIEYHAKESFFDLLAMPSKEEPRAFLYAWIFTPESNLFSILHSSCIPGVKNDQLSENYTSFQNARVDILLLKALSEPNAEKRAQFLREVQYEALQDLRTIPLFYVPTMAICSSQMQGILVPQSGIPIDWAPYYWYLFTSKE
jgi:ABC-type transport system substrate-binding protein